MILQKVLRSLPFSFYSKVSAIEEMKDLKKLTMDEPYGILIAYEMRIEKKINTEGSNFQRIKEDKRT
jgi:hypothetical protein